jgi:hypothetical protein
LVVRLPPFVAASIWPTGLPSLEVGAQQLLTIMQRTQPSWLMLGTFNVAQIALRSMSDKPLSSRSLQIESGGLKAGARRSRV